MIHNLKPFFMLFLITLLWNSPTKVFANNTELTENGNASTTVSIESVSNFTVSIPKSTTMTYDEEEKSYTATLPFFIKGEIPIDKMILILPENVLYTFTDELTGCSFRSYIKNDSCSSVSGHHLVSCKEYQSDPLLQGRLLGALKIHSLPEEEFSPGTYKANVVFEISTIDIPYNEQERFIPGYKQLPHLGKTHSYTQYRNTDNFVSPQGILLEGWTSQCSSLFIPYSNEITVPYGVLSVSTNATSMVAESVLSENITKIKYPATCAKIGTLTNSKLTRLNIPQWTVLLEAGTCQDSTLLETLNINSEFLHMESDSVAGCTSLTSVNFKGQIWQVEDGTFDGCENIGCIIYQGITYTNIEELIEAVEADGGYFRDTDLVLTGIIPEVASGLYDEDGDIVYSWQELKDMGVITVDDGVAYGTGSYESVLNGTLVIDEEVTSIGENKLYESILGSSPNYKSYAFSDCDNLTEVIIPNTVTSIGDYAFHYCINLRYITIPETVTEIGAFAFEGTLWISDMRNLNPIVIVNNVLVDVSACQGELIIPNTVNYITTGCLGSSSQITKLTIPGSVQEMTYSFGLTENLTTVVLEEGVSEIHPASFLAAISLTDVTIPSSVKKIGTMAFGNCISLSEIDLPEGLETICQGAFAGTAITTITLPNSIKKLEEGSLQKRLGNSGSNFTIVYNGIPYTDNDTLVAALRAADVDCADKLFDVNP